MPSGPASKARMVAGLTRMTSQLADVADFVVESHLACAAGDDVDLFLFAMAVRHR